MRFSCCLLMVAMLTATAATAQNQTPIPQQTQVSSMNGDRVKLASLVSSGRWILIFVRPHDNGSESLLALLAQDKDLKQMSNFVILCGCDGRSLQKVASSYPEIGQTLWYSDQNFQALNDLKLSAVPGLAGVDSGYMQWALGAVGSTPGKTKSVLVSWLRPPAKP